MRHMLLLSMLAVSITFLSAPTARAEFLEELEGAGYMEEGIVYGKIGERELKLNLYHPSSGEGPFPAVVFIHGGGWRAGHRGHFSRQAMYLAARGYVCACIEYRLSGEARFPAAIEDVKCAIRWMRAEAAKHFKADTSRIAVSGGSAGGHLALLAGTSGDIAELEGTGGWNEYSSRVHCVAAFNPACDFSKQFSNAVGEFLGGSAEEVPEAYRMATPASWLDKNDPPMILLHGTDDRTVPYTQAVEFVGRLKDMGIITELYSAQGKGHSWFSFPPDFVPTTHAMESFFEKHLK
jgi:acetyl esterase/lipase